MVFGALPRDRHYAGVEIDFTPAQPADLFTPATGQDQQPDDAAEIVIPAAAPDRPQLTIREHALARLDASLWVIGADDRIALAQPLAHRPTEQCRQIGSRAGGCRAAVLLNDLLESRCDICALDGFERPIVHRPPVIV